MYLGITVPPNRPQKVFEMQTLILSATQWLMRYLVSWRKGPAYVTVTVCILGFVLLTACQQTASTEPTPTIQPEPTLITQREHDTNNVSDTIPNGDEIAEDAGPYLLFNQRWIEGLSSSPIDMEDVDAVFWYVFSGLSKEVYVYPSENYYYFILYADQRQFWGNIRLPTGRRDRGVLSFGYFEYRESSFGIDTQLKRSKFFTDADGLRIDKKDDFTYVVRYGGKEVTFNLHRLLQEPPKLFPLGESEIFVERTFDESGFQFFLLFNNQKNYLFWVLNEEELVPDIFEPLGEDILVGKRSGFAFWVDSEHNNRKVFVAVSGQNATRNNYYDGPFDQLADNYADEADIAYYLQRAYPSVQGRIDKYGYYTDTETPSRVAVYAYYVYYTEASLQKFILDAKASDDPFQFIKRGGR